MRMRQKDTIAATSPSQQTAATALAVFIALGAATNVAFAIWPVENSFDPIVLAASGGFLAAFAGFTLVVLPRLHPVFLDVWVAAMTVGVTYAAYLGRTASSELAAAMGLCLLAAFSGYFFSGRRLVLQVAVMIVLFGSLTIASDHLESPVYAVLVAVTLVALAWLVSRLTTMLAEAAIRDPLTGILNRRGLIEAAPLVQSFVQRTDHRTSVVAIDLNGFKGYNDRHGHAAGDRLLVDLAHAWQETLRSADILARVGGDEFILVLPDTDTAAAHSILARLHEVSRSRWASGVVEWGRGEPLADVLRRADKALYLAKSGRVGRSDEPATEPGR